MRPNNTGDVAHGRRSEEGVNPDFDESESESWSSSSGGDSSRQAEEGCAGHRRRRRAHKAFEHDDSGEQSEPDEEDPQSPRSARPKRRSAGSTPAAGGDQAQAADQGLDKETTNPRARSSSHRQARFAEDSDLVDELDSRRGSADRRERAERHHGERSRGRWTVPPRNVLQWRSAASDTEDADAQRSAVSESDCEMSQRSTTRDARPAASRSFSPERTRSLVKKRKDACAHDALGGIGGAQSAGTMTKTQLLPRRNPHLDDQPLLVGALQTRQQDSAGGAVDSHSRRVLPRQGRATPTHPSGELGSPTRRSSEHIGSVTSGAVARGGVIARIEVTTRMRVPVHAPHPWTYRSGSWRRATRTVPAREGPSPTCQIARLRRRSGAHHPGDSSDAARSISLALADTRERRSDIDFTATLTHRKRAEVARFEKRQQRRQQRARDRRGSQSGSDDDLMPTRFMSKSSWL